jgi:regulator of nucleoside diphosphate kinase
MQTSHIQITQTDYNKLQKLLREFPMTGPQDKSCREALRQELERADIIPSDEISPDVVTLNSRVRLRDLDEDETMEFTIVLPEEADAQSGRISILAPLGTAMLGYRAGDDFEWNVPGGHCRFHVEEVLFQPETANRAA